MDDSEMMHDKFKTQNCRMFHREKFCPFGKRCHFRHDHRTFTKIHKAFYMSHACALRLTAEEILAEVRSNNEVRAFFVPNTLKVTEK